MRKIQKFNVIVPALMVAILVVISSCNKDKIDPQSNHDKHCNCITPDNTETPDNYVSFIRGHNYYVRNDVESKAVQTLTLETQEQFDSIFGPATLMGEDGAPTAINFNTQFVIAIVDTLSTKEICLQPMYIAYEGDDLVLHYHKTIGEEMTWTMRNMIITIVDKQFTGDVKSVVHL